ncbi:MAG: hypothetical protein FWG64_14810 [Firmicutes bacterium]|nr:hypothetical protein [Bacillota bacterium]
MRKNIYLKSMLRQPGRTFLIMLLIAIVVFAVVLRVSEFINLNSHISQIAETYTSIGLLQADSQLADVSPWADIVANSQFVGFDDRRRFAEGILEDFFSADMSGMDNGFFWNGIINYDNQPRITETLFVGYLWNIEEMDEDNSWMQFWVSWLGAGMPEHIQQGNSVSVAVHHNVMLNGEMVRINPTDFLQPENNYLVRAYFREPVGPAAATWFPNANSVGLASWGGPTVQDLTLLPLNENLNDFDEIFWVLPVEWVSTETGELVQSTLDYVELDDFQPLFDNLEKINRNQRAVFLQTTRNMYLMPQMLVNSHLRMINDFNNPGRLINFDDYINQNPVAVVNADFARIRQLSLGDTFVVNVSPNQFVSGVNSRATGWGIFNDFVIRSENLENAENAENSQDSDIRLELEIIGIVENGLPGFRTQAPRYIYIPDSLLPADFAITGIENTLPADRFSFMLTSSRHEQTFYNEYNHLLEEMGVNLTLLWTGSVGFWIAADSILTMAGFNAIAMIIALVLVFVISSAILLQQRRKDFAILRALGVSSAKIFMQLFACVIIIIAPAILVGSFAAWQFTQSEIFYVNLDEILSQVAPQNIPGAGVERHFLQIVPPMDITAGLPIYLILGMSGIFFAIIFIMIAFGAIYMLKRSTLAMLQGTVPKMRLVETVPISKKFEMPNLQEVFATTKKWEISNKMQYIYKNIVRAPLQSVLCLIVALAFMLLLGWLQQSIFLTELEIATIHDTTPVEIEVFAGSDARALSAGSSLPMPFDRRMDDFIATNTINRIRESDYFHEVYYVGAHFISFLVNSPTGVLPVNWRQNVGFDESWGIWDFSINQIINPMIGVHNLEQFVQRSESIFVDGVVGDLAITFADGFGYSDFANPQADFLPIIVSQSTLNARNLQLGDVASISYRLVLPRVWYDKPAIIIGVHNDHISGSASQQAMIVPLQFLEENIGSWLGYTTLSFEVTPEYSNTESLAQVRQTVDEIIRRGDGTFWILDFFMWDEELRNLSGALEQVLILLNLLYPIVVAIAVAVAIFLSILLMLQNAKMVAIMSVLGSSKPKIALMLCIKQLAVFLGGIILGLLLTLILGWNFSLILPLSLNYFVGAIIGSIFGAILVTKKSPIDMLQVRE